MPSVGSQSRESRHPCHRMSGISTPNPCRIRACANKTTYRLSLLSYRPWTNWPRGLGGMEQTVKGGSAGRHGIHLNHLEPAGCRADSGHSSHLVRQFSPHVMFGHPDRAGEGAFVLFLAGNGVDLAPQIVGMSHGMGIASRGGGRGRSEVCPIRLRAASAARAESRIRPRSNPPNAASISVGRFREEPSALDSLGTVLSYHGSQKAPPHPQCRWTRERRTRPVSGAPEPPRRLGGPPSRSFLPTCY